MESLTVNLIGAARLIRHGGRDYLVAPVTSIVPGVLNGSQGALFYPPHEIRANVSDWDRKPLTVYHPMSPDGRHISAHTRDGRLDPAVWSRQGIGHIQNSRYWGKLQHEAWFDVARTQNADRRFGTDMLPRLRAGKSIELSTGLYTDNEPVQALNGFQPSFNGRPYTHVARNYRPDHLAILPNQVGACSVADGCGVLVNRRFSINSENQPRDEYGRWLSEVNEILQHTVGKTHEDFPRDPKQLHSAGALPKQAAVALVTSGREEKVQQLKVQKWPAGKIANPKKFAAAVAKLREQLDNPTGNAANGGRFEAAPTLREKVMLPSGRSRFVVNAPLQKRDIRVLKEMIESHDKGNDLKNSASTTVSRLLAAGHVEEVPGSIHLIRPTKSGREAARDEKGRFTSNNDPQCPT